MDYWRWKWVEPVTIYNPEEALPGYYWVHEDGDTLYFFYVERNEKNDYIVASLVNNYNMLREQEAV